MGLIRETQTLFRKAKYMIDKAKESNPLEIIGRHRKLRKRHPQAQINEKITKTRETNSPSTYYQFGFLG